MTQVIDANLDELLQRNQPFSRMPTEHRGWIIDRAKVQHFAPGEVVLSPKDSAGQFFLVAKGLVCIEAMGKAVAPEKRLLGELSSGECFPIEALQEQRPVFSIFRAQGEVTCFTLTEDQFNELIGISEVFRDFCVQRADSFLDSSRRIYHSHFLRRSEDAASLQARLGTLKLPMPPVCLSSDPIQIAVEKLAQTGAHSVVVLNFNKEPIGIFTVHDLLRRVLTKGGNLYMPLCDFMTHDLVTLSPEADGYEAALAMTQHGVQQVLIVENKRLLGVVSERDLFSLQRVAMSQLSSRIKRANDLNTLKQMKDEIRILAINLMSQGLASGPLMRIISSLNDHLTYRVIELEVAAYTTAVPDFSWLAIGSEGRHEQTLYTDQDNGIIFDPQGMDENEARQAILPLARKINDALAECGFPLCKGGVMASNPDWCLSLAEWRRRFATWLNQPDPEALLNASIFFDFRSIYGENALAKELSDWLMAAMQDKDRFLHNFASQALNRTPPLGMIRDFVTDRDPAHPGTIDLKLYGATIFVDAARIFSLMSKVPHSNTAKRIEESATPMRINHAEANAWVDAFHYIQMLRLRSQCELIDQGMDPHNRIDPNELNDLDRKVLLESLRQARKVQKKLELSFGH